jgi:ribonucleotide monophosphatase NagD (HAD superfamily)
MTTQAIQDLLKNSNDKLIAVDMDGVLCEGEMWSVDDDQKPIQENIDYINSLYKNGAHIIINSARFPSMYQATLAWLIKYGVLFHGISLSKKCGADLYIDDKCINSKDLIIK